MLGPRQILARFVRGLRPHAHHPVIARRVRLRCPHSGKVVEVDVDSLWGDSPRRLLRCSERPECPPACDQACRTEPELLHGPAEALVIASPGPGAAEDVD